MSNGQGKSDKAKQAPGQQKVHTMSRTNPDTGVLEEREVTNEDWRLNGKTYRAEGWTRPDDEETDVTEPPTEG